MKRSLYETNKKLPVRYRELILEVLEHYPDLRETHIRFEIKKKAAVPYGTRPVFMAMFCKPANRVYRVTLQEEAKPPTEQVLFRNLTDEMRRGVIAHELMHVVQYQAEDRKGLLRLLFGFARQPERRKLERDADKGAVDRGFGEGLYRHAVYLRSVPGYVRQRPQLLTDYLQPDEILEYMHSLNAQVAAGPGGN